MDDTTNPMPGTPPDDPQEPLGEAAWAAIDSAIVRLEEGWRQGSPPDLATLVPNGTDPATQRIILARLVAVDMEWRWRTGQQPRDEGAAAGEDQTVEYVPCLPPRPRLADYVPRYPLLGPLEQLPVDLLVEEYYVRLRYGDRPTHQEYLERFGSQHPELAQRLRAVDDETAPAPDPAQGDPAPGTTVEYFGDYVLMEKLGEGGMGVVYKARQVSLKRLVAVKMISSGRFADEREVERFRVEAEAAANLDHPGIVRIFEIGEHQGRHYFSMDFVEGESLEARLRESPLPPQEAARLMEQTARAIAYAHGRGVIHRDLKPANVLVSQENQVRVTDFGLAKRLQDDSGLTVTGIPMGTPSYMPPEQAEGRWGEVTVRSDVYSLGATLYALLTGRPPFQAATRSETMLQVSHRDPLPLRQLNPSLPRDLETVCAKCLEKDPRRRYGSADDLAEELKRFLEGRPVQARPVGKPERLWRWCKRNPVVAGLTAAVAFSLVVGIVASSCFAIRATNNANGWQNAAEEAVAEKERAEKQLLRSEWLLYANQIASALREWETNNVSGSWQYLDACRADFRGWEYDYLYTLFTKNQRTFKGHTGFVHSVAFSPDGKRIVSGSGTPDNTVRVWDATSGQELLTLTGHMGQVDSVAFSPDGKRIVSAGYSLKVWDATTGENTLTLTPPILYVNSVAFSPDGKRIVSGSDDSMLKVWDATSGQETLTFKGHARLVNSVAFSPDGRRIVSGSDDMTVKVWNATSGQEMLTLKGHAGIVLSVAFSPDGKRIVSSSGDGTTKVWDATAIKLTQSVERYVYDGSSFTLYSCEGKSEWTESKADGSSGFRFVEVGRGNNWIFLLDSSRKILMRLPIRGGMCYRSTDNGKTWNASQYVDRDGKTGSQSAKTSMPQGRVSAGEKEVMFDLVPDVKLEMTFIPVGEFLMGSSDSNKNVPPSEKPQHRVRITKPFYVGKYLVTQEQWKAVMSDNPSYFPGSKNPVEHVNWHDCQQFLGKLNEKFGVGRGKFQLPTEAQWEYACRAGSTWQFSFGDDESRLDEYAWYRENSGGKPHPVGEKKPNAWGLYDMYGNVWEWCADWYDEGYYAKSPTDDPEGPSMGTARVNRGGGWRDSAGGCRSAIRSNVPPETRNSGLGFRVCLVLAEKAGETTSTKPTRDRLTTEPTDNGDGIRAQTGEKLPAQPPETKATKEETYVPKDLDDCFTELDKKLSKEDIEKIKGGSEQQTIGLYHFGLGRWMRNNWGLWGGSRLSKWFKEKGVWHPDHMSSIILTSFWRHLNNKPIMLDEQIRHYQDFWNKARVQPQAPGASPAAPPPALPRPVQSSAPSPIL